MTWLQRKLLYFAIGLLYLILPIDLLPDFLPPLLGRLDDLIVAGYLFWRYRKLRHEFNDRWREWTGQTHAEYQKQNSGAGSATGASSKEHSPPPRDPYTILELDRSASPEEIKKQYHQMVAQYHPDKVDHLGRELQELAHSKMLDLQWAYERLAQ